MTGKEKSIFFPLLNYAAMRILKGNNEIDTSYEKAALECVRDNIRYIVMCRNGVFKNGFVMAKIEDVEDMEENELITAACKVFRDTVIPFFTARKHTEGRQ